MLCCFVDVSTPQGLNTLVEALIAQGTDDTAEAALFVWVVTVRIVEAEARELLSNFRPLVTDSSHLQTLLARTQAAT